MELINFYETKGVKKHMKSTHNPHYDKHRIKVPFRMLIVGASGTGKTSTLLNLIRAMPDTFSKICVITKCKNEALYSKEFLKGYGVDLNLFNHVVKIDEIRYHAIFEFVLLFLDNDTVKIIRHGRY